MQEGGRVSQLRITFAGQAYSFAPGQIVRIGRSPDNAIVVPDPIVSREHAQVSWHADSWMLDDLGKGRTFVGGLPVGSLGSRSRWMSIWLRRLDRRCESSWRQTSLPMCPRPPPRTPR